MMNMGKEFLQKGEAAVNPTFRHFFMGQLTGQGGAIGEQLTRESGPRLYPRPSAFIRGQSQQFFTTNNRLTHNPAKVPTRDRYNPTATVVGKPSIPCAQYKNTE
jgi:hypothetical protein